MRWLTSLLLAFVTITSAIEPNLLTNSSFEIDADNDGIADGWIAEIHRSEGGEGNFALDKNVKVHGRFSQRITHTSEKGWVRASQIGIPARPNSLYLFRCWVKANCRFLLIVYAFKADDSYDTFVVAQGAGTGGEWKLFSGVVRTPADARSFKVSLVTDSTGEAWFDGAELILLERPLYIFVPVTTRSLQLDGDLSDDVWRDAEPLTPFLELGTGKITEPATVAKVVATETHLFIAFHCSEPEPQRMRLRTPESGEPAYMDDCVEVYLDLQHSHYGFWQFVVTPKGNKWAQQVEQSRWAKVWWLLPRATQRLITDGWQAATKIGSNFWSAEIAIPFSLLGIKPQTGKVVGINLCRSRKVEGSDQNSAFAYFEGRTFQRPEKFPHIVFEGQVDK
ncbi:MAG: sugar-binding protein, partial [Armatimonadota bacterium]